MPLGEIMLQRISIGASSKDHDIEITDKWYEHVPETVMHASAEGKSLVGGSGGILPQKIIQFGGSETLFLALVMRYVSEKSSLKKTNP